MVMITQWCNLLKSLVSAQNQEQDVPWHQGARKDRGGGVRKMVVKELGLPCQSSLPLLFPSLFSLSITLSQSQLSHSINY